MQQQHTKCKVSRMGQLLEVARRGSSEWLGGPPRVPMAAEQQGEANVKHEFAQGCGTYGTRLIKDL